MTVTPATKRKTITVPAALVTTALGLELTRRTLTGVALVVAAPDAFKSGHHKLWALELGVQKATNEVVPHTGDITRLGRTWTQGWGKVFFARNSLLTATSVGTLAMGLPTVVHDIASGNSSALWNTRDGRTGAIASAIGGYEIARIVLAGADRGNGGFVHSALTSPKLGTWAVAGPAMAVWGAIMLNKMGAFDALGN